MTIAQMQVSSLVTAGAGYAIHSMVPPKAVTAASTIDDLNKTIVVLDNMVPVAEASDPGLKDEVEEEAATYGPLKNISIDVIGNSFVRIKLVYVEPHSAMKAYKAMNGRYFGGSAIKASLE